MTTSEAIVGLLNEMLEADPAATQALIGNRVPCNQTLGDHPTVQVEACGNGALIFVGLLGVLNGLAEADGVRVCSVWDTEERRIIRFELRSAESFG